MSRKNRIPEAFRERIVAELGTDTDINLARKWTETIKREAPEVGDGFRVDRHTIFWMRNQLGVAAYREQTYTPPAFRGKLEDAHPEVKDLIGRVPLAQIARHFGVSRSCVNAAAKRLGKVGRGIDHSANIKELLGV